MTAVQQDRVAHAPETEPEHLDVLVIGAGLSGVAAGYYLQDGCPGRSYAILEARDSMGGTWDLFRYPGVRLDSDMFTLGYAFRPWTDAKAIADGPSILEYVKSTARHYGIDERIRYGHRVVRARWSTPDQRWEVEAERTDTGETVRLTAGFLLSCTGYYRYDEGHTPELPGLDRFEGAVVHPQHWSDDVEWRGKRVVVIGSGATAVTLVPAMVDEVEHVTMLQRSPSYVVAIPNEDPVARLIRRVLPEDRAHVAVRWKNVLLTMANYQLSRRRPQLMRRLMRWGAVRALPKGYDVDTHFNPSYDPWDQRLCMVPDGDLFKALHTGRASVVTDRISTFTPTGIRLESGRELEADLVVTATGLQLLALGGMELEVDGRPVDLNQSLTYKGLMVSDVPNFALALGYTNASWTLKCDLICQYVVRLLQHMDRHGHTQATPRPGPADRPAKPFLSDLTSGYVQRGLDRFPQQGASDPWQLHQNYVKDIRMIRQGDLGEAMEFSSAPAAAPATTPVEVAA